MTRVRKAIYLLEDWLLIGLLVSMITLASGQILLRNLFDFGVIWIDPLLRLLVLWAGMIGATVASRDNRHIRIDLLSRFIPKRTHIALQCLIGLFAFVVCAIIAWYGAGWVLLDYRDGISSFSGLPSWALEIIIPFAFGVIALRYLGHSYCWLMMFIRFDEQRGCEL